MRSNAFIKQKSCARGYNNLHQKQTSYRQRHEERQFISPISLINPMPTVHIQGFSPFPFALRSPPFLFLRSKPNKRQSLVSRSIHKTFLILVPAESAAHTSPQLRLGAQRARIGSRIALLAMKHISCTADTDVASGHLVARSDAVVLIVKRYRGLLAGAVDVACAANAAEEAA